MAGGSMLIHKAGKQSYCSFTHYLYSLGVAAAAESEVRIYSYHQRHLICLVTQLMLRSAGQESAYISYIIYMKRRNLKLCKINLDYKILNM